MRFSSTSAYTLVELLIALTLSLFLLLAVSELFKRVGGTMNDTRSAMSTSVNLNEAAMLLRQDLDRIPSTLWNKPQRIAAGNVDVEDFDGYLFVAEGPNKPFPNPLPQPLPDILPHPYVDEQGNPDVTVGDVDDIIGFTADANLVEPKTPFRGLINGAIEERDTAEIVWFVRGNTLYRRLRLIDDITISENSDVLGSFQTRAEFETKKVDLPQKAGHAFVRADESSDGRSRRYYAIEKGGDVEWKALNSIEDLALRARRFGHDGLSPRNPFPHPLYTAANPGWYYLRMPTLEEELSASWWDEYWKTASNDLINTLQPIAKPDLWNQPHFFHEQDRESGSLLLLPPGTPRHHRAGEDVVLTNVLSFDIKVWDTQTKDFVDLGTPRTGWAGDGEQTGLSYVWDSWTTKYRNQVPPYYRSPPYSGLEAIRITIRCFDPASQVIKQVTLVHRFKD